MFSASHASAAASLRRPTTRSSQNEVPPRSSLPFTVSQVLPGAGGVFHGHLAMAVVAMRDPKLLPSRSGFILTLNIVPAGKVAAVIPCCARSEEHTSEL